MKWIKCRIADLGDVVGGATPSTRDSSNYEGGTIPWITPKDLTNFQGKYLQRGERMITSKGYESCSTQLLPIGSVLFSSRAPIGYIAIAQNDLCTNQGFKSVVPNVNTDSEFLFYLLKYHTPALQGLGSGTTFPEISGKVLKEFIVKIPEQKTDQQKLIKPLIVLDRKIALNNQINDYLDQLLVSLFQEKILKPGEFESWKQLRLTEIANFKNGLAMQKYRPSENDIGLPVLKIKELGAGKVDENTERCSSKIDHSVIVNDGDVVFSWSGTLLVDLWCGGTVGLNQHLFKVTSETFPKWFYFVWIKHHLKTFIALATAKATTMGHIKRGDLEASYVFLPPESKMKELSQLFAPLIEKIIINKIENSRLEDIRDNLLPRLLSGEVSIG